MRKKIKLSVGPGIEVEEMELRDGRWVLSARAAGFVEACIEAAGVAFSVASDNRSRRRPIRQARSKR
jgi:hypothetical protein